MAAPFSTPVDYFNQDATPLKLKSSTENKTKQTKEASDERGDVVAREVYGEVSSPSCDFEVIASSNIDVELGSVNTEALVVYCLTGLSIQTAKATAPSVSMSGESLQAAATVSSTIAVGAIAISTLHKAQILDAAFTLGGTGAKLNTCTLDVSCNLSRATVAGDTVSHDVSGGKKVVKATIIQSGAAVPTITAGTGYAITGPLTCANPDEDYPTWTVELTKDVASVEPTP